MVPTAQLLTHCFYDFVCPAPPPVCIFQMMILDRIKYQLGYPEAARDVLPLKSLLTAVEQYTMGTARPLQQYMELVGLNVTTKEVTNTKWCETGHPPPGFEQFNALYKL